LIAGLSNRVFLDGDFMKIKESLSRCGNIVTQIDTREEVEVILKSFFNIRKDLKII